MTPDELKRWREMYGISQRELAQRLNVSNGAVSRWEDPEDVNVPPYWLKWALPQIEQDLKEE